MLHLTSLFLGDVMATMPTLKFILSMKMLKKPRNAMNVTRFLRFFQNGFCSSLTETNHINNIQRIHKRRINIISQTITRCPCTARRYWMAGPWQTEKKCLLRFPIATDFGFRLCSFSTETNVFYFFYIQPRFDFMPNVPVQLSYYFRWPRWHGLAIAKKKKKLKDKIIWP